MLFAVDYNDNRTFIDDTQSNKEYFCPYCGVPVITKKGNVRQHHFAHSANHSCSDTWEQTKSYDISPWHNEWQECFPKDNQEVKLSLGETKHRADVLIGRTVVEFQHSIMPVKAFDDRNNFYFNLNYKVVWLFDLSDIVDKGDLTYWSTDDGLCFSWCNPKKAFNSYDVKTGCIDLFFQVSANDTACIVRVTDVSEYGFERFITSPLMSKADFLEYLGLVGDVCPAPDRSDLDTNESYSRFKEKYNITLNKQQERAVQSIEGAVLLLAVPGSGKTTVLVNRLGYMVMEKEVDPHCILAITFNKNAAEEMRKRYNRVFGCESGDRIDFRTINSLSLEIYTRYCETNNIETSKLICGQEQKKLFRKIYRECLPDKYYPSESDIIELGTAVAYAKNMMLSKEQISEIDSDYPKFSMMFQKYCDTLKEQNRMDYNDQMVFAYQILSDDISQKTYWQTRYHYICVDEAQDTSKIQHDIIRILAHGNNLFMVGDEDQSIYGFRAAYPKALLNFRADYKNPYILRMERNYRSTPQIVEKAQRFISENKGRYEKNMVANRSDGKPVELITVKSVEEQYMRVLSIAKNAEKETAFLYRDNESSVVLIDLFLRNNIGFRFKKPEMNFFGNTVVRDIIAYLTLAIDSYSINSLKQICNKGIIYLKKKQLGCAVINFYSEKTTVFEAVESQMKYLPYHQRDRADRLKDTIDTMSGKSTEEAIRFLLDSGYGEHLEEKQSDYAKIETLLILAKQEPNISKYLERLRELELLINNGFDTKGYITLSTIHSSKGLEYDTVYMVDVYDGRFPSARKNLFSKSKDNANGEQEERRLFYVGITRAKNELYLFNIEGKPSSYIDSLFPEVRAQRMAAERKEKERLEAARKRDEEQRSQQEEAQREAANKQYIAEVQRREEELREIKKRFIAEKQRREEERRKRLEEEPERQRIAAEQAYQDSYKEVKDLDFTQKNMKITDSRGERWIKCEKCGRILLEKKFVSYGGKERGMNLGECRDCSRNKRSDTGRAVNAR